MSKFQLQCEQTAKNAYVAAMDEVSLFCKILGYPDSQANYLIDGDPHGIVDIMEGYRIFKMTYINVVLSEYERWLSIYKTNDELRKAVDSWYYYCQEWYEKHSYEEPRWVSVDERLPEKEERYYILIRSDSNIYKGYYDGYDFYAEDDSESPDLHIYNVTHWKPIITPEQEAERIKGCPNLRSWLAGCPVDGMREATIEWKEEQRKALEAAHQRVEEAKQALYQAMEEEVKLNKF